MPGSGKYLDDRKTSSKQARITLQYKSTSRYESLTMEQLGTEGIEHPDVFEKDLATHVVTGIEYGADAFFVFDRQVSSNETVRDVEGRLNLVVSKFKSEEKNFFKKLSRITGISDIKIVLNITYYMITELSFSLYLDFIVLHISKTFIFLLHSDFSNHGRCIGQIEGEKNF